MSEVTISKKPEITVNDARGRAIVIREPNLLSRINYKIAAGKDRESIEDEIFVLSWIVSIDGVAVHAPNALIDIKSLIQTLDNDGYIAVTTEILKQANIQKELHEADQKKVE